MSWSVNAKGKAAALAAHVKPLFEQPLNYLSIPAERKACQAAANIVADHLAFLAQYAPQSIITVEASGSAYHDVNVGSIDFNLKISNQGAVIE